MRGDRGFLMIVEDDRPRAATRTGSSPRAGGWGTCLATTASEALALLDRGPEPDCIVPPMRGPDRGGATVLRKVREAGFPTRVTICTGPATVEEIDYFRILEPDLMLIRHIDADAVGEAATKARGR